MADDSHHSQPREIKVTEHAAALNGASYAHEKLGVAVWKLATGPGGIKSRLADAYIELAILQPSDIPGDLLEDWRRIRADLTSGKMQYETAIVDGELVQRPVGLLLSTLRHMRTSKATRIAERICLLDAKLEALVKDRESEAA